MDEFDQGVECAIDDYWYDSNYEDNKSNDYSNNISCQKYIKKNIKSNTLKRKTKSRLKKGKLDKTKTVNYIKQGQMCIL